MYTFRHLMRKDWVRLQRFFILALQLQRGENVAGSSEKSLDRGRIVFYNDKGEYY